MGDGGRRAVLAAAGGHQHGAVDVVDGGRVAVPPGEGGAVAVVGGVLVAKLGEGAEVGEHSARQHTHGVRPPVAREARRPSQSVAGHKSSLGGHPSRP